MNFEGKRIVITGASKGLGAVCARYFASQGACLALIARDGKKLEEVRLSCTFPERHKTFSVDLTSSANLVSTFGEVNLFLKEVDVVLHVAGGG